MAGQFLDDFQGYGGNYALMLNGKYAEASGGSLIVDPDPTAGGAYCIRGTSFGMVRRVLSAPQTTVGLAARVWLLDLSAETTFFNFADAAVNLHIFITVDTSGYVKAYRYDTAGNVLIGTSANPVMVANAWQHMEAKVFLNVATGTVEVRREGVVVLNIGPLRTTSDRAGVTASVQNAGIYRFPPNILGREYYIKDFAIWDGSGARNNNFLGSRVVKRLRPNGDVVFPWTASTGTTGYNRINSNAPTDDTSYIYAPDPAPAASVFSLEDLAINVTSVAFIQGEHRSRKTDGGDGNIQLGVKSGGSTGLGADRPITTAYTYYSDIFDSDPNGGGAWSVAAVNALQLQLNRTL